MITCLNIFPSKNGMSSNLIPAAIIRSYQIIDYNKLNIKFGAYAKVCTGNTNRTKERTVGTIAIRPANKQGKCYFMYLVTGEKLYTFICTKLPINDQVMQRVNDLAAK